MELFPLCGRLGNIKFQKNVLQKTEHLIIHFYGGHHGLLQFQSERTIEARRQFWRKQHQGVEVGVGR